METSIDTAKTLESIRSAAGDLDERVREIAKQRPIVAVLGAALLGFLAARLISRSKR
jgi:hypothetical protein